MATRARSGSSDCLVVRLNSIRLCATSIRLLLKIGYVWICDSKPRSWSVTLPLKRSRRPHCSASESMSDHMEGLSHLWRYPFSMRSSEFQLRLNRDHAW